MPEASPLIKSKEEVVAEDTLLEPADIGDAAQTSSSWFDDIRSLSLGFWLLCFSIVFFYGAYLRS